MLRVGVLVMGLLLVDGPCNGDEVRGAATMILHTYEARIRVDGSVTTTQVKASDAGKAKKLVQQQFPKATVLSVKRID
jgi:hypothetical protein